MKLTPLGSNINEVETDDYRILFSYRTPVAYYDKRLGKYFKTIARWSNTTSRHISKWHKGDYEPAEQDTISALADREGK